jgi:hypothetical protein
MDGIFISYRRDDSAGYAGRLYDRLVAHFGPNQVFMDVEEIEPGLDFVVAIEEAVSSCRVLIAVIGDEWTTGTDAAGRRRLDDPNDFIRLETSSALQRGIRVVPVLVGGAVMPLSTELPEDLRSLTRRQAIEINHKQWEASTGELIRTLENILKTPVTNKVAASQPSIDRGPAIVGATSGGTTSNGAATQGQARPWILPAAIAAAAVAAAGVWMALGGQESDTQTEKQAVSNAAKSPPVAAVSAAQTGTQATNPSAALPATATVAAAKPVPAPEAEPKPAARPAPAPVAPAAALAPVIRQFNADISASRARLCYRVSNADSLTLSPRPGELDKLTDDCVNVEVDTRTTFTLTARNGSETIRKTLVVAPKQVVATRPDKESAKAAAPAAVAPSPLPMKGERWTYRSSGKWATSPKRRFEIVAQSEAGGVVTDELRASEPADRTEVHRARSNKPDFIAWNVIGPEFSPYLGAYVDLARQNSFSDLPTPDLEPQWRDWYSSAKVLGKESVQVPAGTFDAFKVEVWSSRHQTGSRAEASIEPLRVNYLIWYAPQAKRYVRMERRVTTADNSESEKDVFELVSHRLP